MFSPCDLYGVILVSSAPFPPSCWCLQNGGQKQNLLLISVAGCHPGALVTSARARHGHSAVLDTPAVPVRHVSSVFLSAPSLPSPAFPLRLGLIGHPPSALAACGLPCSVLVGFASRSGLSWLLWAVARVRRSSSLAKSDYVFLHKKSRTMFVKIHNRGYKKSRRKFQRDGAPVNGHKKAPQARGGRKGKLYEEIRKNCINAG